MTWMVNVLYSMSNYTHVIVKTVEKDMSFDSFLNSTIIWYLQHNVIQFPILLACFTYK
jgi:hypothetical protein